MNETFGRYTLIRRLAVGGMAEIFLAALHGDAGFEKKVVVKRILPHLSADSEFVKMFVDEAVVAARLSHPNIIQTYDFGCVAGSHYIAMEYVEGVDLNRLLHHVHNEERRLLPAQVAALGERLARGLAYTHRLTDDDGKPLGIVHRDISPHNVMISFTGEIKVMDFGIAKAAARSTQTAAGTIKGKLAYMSPEQAAGESATRLSDQFALGIVLWECLSGERLFLSDSEIQLIKRVKACDIIPLRVVRPDIPPALEAIIMRALRKDPSARYADLEQMQDDLMAFRYSLGAAGMVQLGPLARICERHEDTHTSWSWAQQAQAPALTRPLVRQVSGPEGATPIATAAAFTETVPVVPTAAAAMILLPQATHTLADDLVHLPVAVQQRPKSAFSAGDLCGSHGQAAAVMHLSLGASRLQEGLLAAANLKCQGHTSRRPHRGLRPHVSQPPPPHNRSRRMFITGVLALILGSTATVIWHRTFFQPHFLESTVPPHTSALHMIQGKPLPTGRLSLTAEGPEMDVYLGKNCLGTTPLANERVPAGRLALRLVNEDVGITRCFEIDVPAGGTARGLVTALGPTPTLQRIPLEPSGQTRPLRVALPLPQAPSAI